MVLYQSFFPLDCCHRHRHLNDYHPSIYRSWFSPWDQRDNNDPPVFHPWGRLHNPVSSRNPGYSNHNVHRRRRRTKTVTMEESLSWQYHHRHHRQILEEENSRESCRHQVVRCFLLLGDGVGDHPDSNVIVVGEKLSLIPLSLIPLSLSMMMMMTVGETRRDWNGGEWKERTIREIFSEDGFWYCCGGNCRCRNRNLNGEENDLTSWMVFVWASIAKNDEKESDLVQRTQTWVSIVENGEM